MFFQRKLPVQWTQSGQVHGILRGSLSCEHAGIDCIDALELLVDGQRHPVSGDFVPAVDGQLHVNVHTHLLTDESHRLAIVARQGRDQWESDEIQVEVANAGRLAGQVRGSLQRHGTPIAYAGLCDSRHYDFADAGLTPWFDSPDADRHIDGLLASGDIDDLEAEMLRGFVRDGFLVLPEGLEDELVDRALADIDRAIVEKWEGYRYGESQRLQQMHREFGGIRDIWLHPRIHRVLELLFDEESRPCQSLVYVFGSQQDAHQDTIHLTPFPAGYMCGVWVALEEVREGSGELMVYPGSHRLPRVYMNGSGCGKVGEDWRQFGETVVKCWERLIADSGLVPAPYLAKRGSVLIWHENLMHAGSVRRDPSLSRRSVVTHNFARGSLVFYDSTGLVGYTYDRRSGE